MGPWAHVPAPGKLRGGDARCDGGAHVVQAGLMLGS